MREFDNLDRWPKSPERLAAERAELLALRAWTTDQLCDELDRCTQAFARLGMGAPILTGDDARYFIEFEPELFELDPLADLAGIVATTRDILTRCSAHYS